MVDTVEPLGVPTFQRGFDGDSEVILARAGLDIGTPEGMLLSTTRVRFHIEKYLKRAVCGAMPRKASQR